MRLPTALLPLVGLVPGTSASAPTSVSLTLQLPASFNPPSLPARTHATLADLGAHRAAPLAATGAAFVFRNVTPGSYLADVHCPVAAFAPLRVDVAPDGSVAAWDTFRGNDWDNRGEAAAVRHVDDGWTAEARFLGRKNYFMERPRFSVLSILKNPMILMGLVSMLIFVGMPYLVENMDPEMKAEFEAQQRKGGPMAAMMGSGSQAGNPLGDFDMAAFLAGSKESSPAELSAGAKSQGVRR